MRNNFIHFLSLKKIPSYNVRFVHKLFTVILGVTLIVACGQSRPSLTLLTQDCHGLAIKKNILPQLSQVVASYMNSSVSLKIVVSTKTSESHSVVECQLNAKGLVDKNASMKKSTLKSS
ncbi:MAG: hypothetical protein AAGB12_03315 [Pseudomonadota bacterium]